MKFFLVGLITLIAVSYFILVQRRIIKYKKISRYIGGKYVKDNIFKTGKIIGIKNGKKYIIEPVEVGDRAAESHFRTFFSIECKNEGMLLLIKANFFKKFPDWKNIHKLKEKKESNDFIGNLLNKNYKYNSYGRIDKYIFNDVQRKLIESIFCGQKFGSEKIYTNLKKSLTFHSLIQIERNKIYLDIGELLLDKRKIRENIDLLEQISKRIEDQPII